MKLWKWGVTLASSKAHQAEKFAGRRAASRAIQPRMRVCGDRRALSQSRQAALFATFAAKPGEQHPQRHQEQQRGKAGGEEGGAHSEAGDDRSAARRDEEFRITEEGGRAAGEQRELGLELMSVSQQAQGA